MKVSGQGKCDESDYRQSFDDCNSRNDFYMESAFEKEAKAELVPNFEAVLSVVSVQKDGVEQDVELV